ncbi:MAG: PEP-CTERM sorting domain-containing protein [Acidobacteriaceae bacterium]|jgi:hypothetical protein
MKFFTCTGRLAIALVAVLVLSPLAVAHAQSLNITYYTVAESDKDGGDMCCGVSDNYVLPTLGVDGLPVYNPAATAVSGSIYTPKDLLPDDEITWWSPTLNNGSSTTAGASDVVQTGTGVVMLPFSNNAFYAPNGTGSNDSSAFQAAVLTGTLVVPSTETVGFSISSDDMAFLYLDGTIACSDGGVHGATAVPCTTSTLSAGDYSLELFYVDLDPTQAALDFSITTSGVTTTPPAGGATPEPGTFTLLGSGLLGLVGVVRRRFTRTA